MPMKVIISGAGIAGLSLAHWLGRIGATPIVVERAPRFQPLGHYISLKGNGVEMIRRMGILDACEARSAPLEEVRFYSAASGRYLRSEHTATLAKTLGGYILLRRADLQSALYDLTADHADIRFGVQIVEARPDTAQVEVTLSDGTTERGDLLVGADGIHSAVRGLAFGPGFERPLGGYYIAITQTLHHGLAPVVHSYLGTGRMVNLLPVSPDSVSAVVYLGADVDAPPRNDVLAMRDYLVATCAGFPDEVRKIVGNLGADDFVFADAIAQIEMPRITQGRAALVGDAGNAAVACSIDSTSANPIRATADAVWPVGNKCVRPLHANRARIEAEQARWDSQARDDADDDRNITQSPFTAFPAVPQVVSRPSSAIDPPWNCSRVAERKKQAGEGSTIKAGPKGMRVWRVAHYADEVQDWP